MKWNKMKQVWCTTKQMFVWANGTKNTNPPYPARCTACGLIHGSID